MVLHTPLYDKHLELKGKMVEFAGYSLPVQYEDFGLVKEHTAVRTAVGIFDVSHMGEVEIYGDGAEATVNNLISNDISDMVSGQIKYTMMLNDDGGQVDDLLVYKYDNTRFLLVVNASNCAKDVDWIRKHLLVNTSMKDISDTTGQIALQGPLAQKVMLELVRESEIPQKYYTFITNDGLGVEAIISRTGYTGEDGFEIYASSNDIVYVYEKILEAGKEYGIVPCGLGCRDTLRFEATLPLYGHELNDNHLASEVGLNMFVKMDKETFIGKQALIDNLPKFKRKGVRIVDKGIAREHCLVYDEGGNEIGVVTTGTHSPTLGYPIALLRVKKEYEGESFYIDVRGRKLKAESVKLPFYKRSK